MELEHRFLEVLRENNIRSTAPRRAVFATLQTVSEPLSLRAIVEKTQRADRASVYRTLELFERLGVVQLILVGWKKHFELAAPYKAHHHHIRCERCGKVVSIKSPSLEQLIKTVSEQKGFQLHSHTLELSGCCDGCQAPSEA